MKKRIQAAQIYITALFLFFITTTSTNAQSLPAYWSDLKPGKYNVGFKSMYVFDTTREYDLSLGDSTSPLKSKKPGRPILLNIWYPAANTNAPVIQLKDYFEFPEDESTHNFFCRFESLSV